MVGPRPAFDLVKPGGVGDKAARAGVTDVIGDGPCIELRHPGRDAAPDRVIGPDACLREKRRGGDAGFVDVGVP